MYVDVTSDADGYSHLPKDVFTDPIINDPIVSADKSNLLIEYRRVYIYIYEHTHI